MIGNRLHSWMGSVFGCVAIVFAGLAGASDPTSTPVSGENSPSPKYWAYRPVVRPAVPQVTLVSQVRTPIDQFILAALESKGLALAPEASKEELLRRAKFDLHGLPPTQQEREQFLADTDPKAFERLVDRLLESPHYGERWGRIWLDVVRFADSAGYNADPLRPLAYKYRDYVIRSFNRDTPYDRFVQEQIAGDELFPDSADALIGAGFNRLPPDESNASNILLARQDQLNDLTTSVGAIFLGQSLGCAQCHDHKFDAITQEDFYRIQAFFAGIIPVESAPVGTAEQVLEYQQKVQEWLAESAAVRHELKQLDIFAWTKAGQERRMKFPAEVLAALDTPPLERTALQQQYCFFAERQMDIPEKDLEKAYSPEQKKRKADLKRELKQFEARKPKAAQMIDVTTAFDGPETPKTFRLAGGSYNKPKEEIPPGFLSAISDVSVATISPPRPGTTGRRTALARWLTDPANPLPSRVMVNRLWQGHFGRGLAENANDFGVQSPGPTHPELLDWLAAELISRGWSIKSMHRLIMTSAVYRQATDRESGSESMAIGGRVDPGNRMYWHFDRRRLEGESLRDAMLTTSGLLNVTMGGPGVRPELPPNFKGRDWDVSNKLSDRYRRSVYILVKRNLPYPFLQTFDQPDTFESCARRQMTTTGPQALTLLNSESVVQYAQAFAGRLLLEQPSASNSELIQKAYILALGREPQQDELSSAEQFLIEQSQIISPRLHPTSTAGQVDKTLLPMPFPKFQDPAHGAALVDFCHALFNANEFLYVD